MAKKSEVKAEPKATENGSEPKESKYAKIVVRWHKSIADFEPITALVALAEAQGYVGKSNTAKKSGNVTFTVDTAESAKSSGRGRPRKLVSKETEQNAIKLLRAAMKDPSKAPEITRLLAASAEGKDVSAELSAVVGLPV